MEALEMAQQLHSEQLYHPGCPLDMYALGLLLLEMAGGCRPAGHEEALQQAHSAGLLQGPAFTQQHARSLCVRAPHQPAYVDMVNLQAFASILCKRADSSVCMACQHLLVRNSGSSIVSVVWKHDDLVFHMDACPAGVRACCTRFSYCRQCQHSQHHQGLFGN